MCDAVATGREHVPPRCIFPEKKDADGRNFRADLITVPSCDKHNTEKSKNDEFLMVSLAGILGNNSIGYRQHFTKVHRALRRTAGRLLDQVFRKRTHYVVRVNDNAFVDVIWGTPDYTRLEDCFRHIAFGLFSYQFDKRFNGQLRVVMGHLQQSDKNAASFAKLVKHRADLDLRDKARLGKNPEVFYYQFIEPDQFGLFLLRMCFYGGVDIYVAFIPDGAVIPSNLGMSLLQHGVKTFIRVEDKSYEFN